MADKTITYRLSADISQFRAQMAQAATSVKAAGEEMTGSTAKGVQFRQGLSAVGRVAGGIGLAAGAALGAAVMKAADFDQAMSRVNAATHESAANMQRLRDAALEAGAKTVFSANEAAQGEEALAKAGVKTNDILRGGLTGALSLASAGEIDVATAAEDAATAMTQFGLKGKDVPHIADLLAAAAGKAQGEVGDFSMALNQAGLVANQTGLSLEETMGALGAFASKGLLGSDAGTSLKTFLLSLSGNSAQAKNLMDQLGFSAYDANGKFVGLAETAQRLRTAFGSLTDEQRSRDMKQIFGTDAVRAATVLYGQGADGIQKWINKVNDQGYAADTARRKLDNLKGDLTNLGGSLETALIGTGEGAQGPLRGLVQELTKVVNAYNKLPDPAKGGVGAALGITALSGLGLFAFTKIVTGIADTRVAIEQLGVAGTRAAASMRFLGAAMLAVAAVKIADKIDDTTISTQKMKDGLDALAAGSTTGTFDNLTRGAKSLGDALHNAAYSDLNQIGIGAKDEIGKIDAALGQLEKRNPTKAAAAFRSIRAAAAAAGVDINDLIQLFPKYTAALNKAMQAGIKRNNLGWFAHLAGQLTGNTELVQRLGDSVNHLPKKALVQILTPGAIKSGRDISNLAKQYHLLPPEVRTIMRALDFTKPQINAVLKSLHNVDSQHPNPKIGADARQVLGTGHNVTQLLGGIGRMHPTPNIGATDHASPVINHVQAGLNGLHDKTVTVTTRYISGGGGSHGASSVGQLAGAGHAAGGLLRGSGTGTSDSIPIMGSNGEYIVRAAAVSKYGVAMLHSINAMRYASGGLVSAPSFTGPVDISGTVHIPGQGTGRLEGTMRAVAREEISKDCAHVRRTG